MNKKINLNNFSQVLELASKAGNRITRKAIKHFQGIKFSMNPEMRLSCSREYPEPKTRWDEICIQTQHSKADIFCPDLDMFVYNDVIHRIVIENLKTLERDALWLTSHWGMNWSYSEIKQNLNNPVNDMEIVDTIIEDYFLPTAMDWSNPSIRLYHENNP